MTKKILVSGIICLLFSVLCGCKEGPKINKVDMTKKERVVNRPQSKENSLRIAVGGMITPKEGFSYYRQFLDYIGEKMDMEVEFVDKESYAEINKLVRTGEVDVAFVCGGPYVEGHDSFGMELLVAPQAYGESVYYSYIIVPRDSPVKELEGLRGKTFAFTDPLSNSGKLVPTYMLARINETPDSFFRKHFFSQSHDKSIKAVAQGVADGAAVDSLIWEYANRTNPVYTSKTRIIKKSPPYGIPPVVVRPGIDPRTKKKLKEIFLDAHNDKKGREILNGMMIDKFTVTNDKSYNSIREMQLWLAKQKSGKDMTK